MNTKTIKFDINKNLYDTLIAKQGDTKSRFLLFNLLDGGIPFSLKNRSVRVYAIKPDGTEIFNDLIITDAAKGYCILELTTQMLAVAGTVKLELMVMEGDKKLTSNIFYMDVKESINSEKAVVSTNEFGTLLTALASLNEYDNYKNEIKNARGGQVNLKTRLDNFDEQLDNNTKQLDAKIYEVANKGTTVEVLERVTKEEIDRQVADGTIANLTIADNSITVNKIAFFDDVEEGEKFKIAITKGLVIHLDASIREGNKLIDNSDNKYDITLENFNGSFGSNYINFNGSGGKGVINIPSTDIYTHEFVINQRTTSSRCSALSSLNYNLSAGMVSYYSASSTILNYGINGQGRNSLSLGKDLIPIGIKTHIVITFDTNTNKFKTYKNGVLFSESDVVNNYNPTVTSIGIGIWATNFSENDLNADVYMVRAYNRTLTHEEILNNFNNEMGV